MRKSRVKQDWAFEIAKKIKSGEWDIAKGEGNAPHLVKQSMGILGRVAAIIRRNACPRLLK